MAEAIYSERACALKTLHEDQRISTAGVDILPQCAGRPRDGNGPSTTAAMNAADHDLLAALLFPADAADDGVIPVEAAEDLLRRLAAPGDRLVAVAEGDMIGVLVDRRSDTVLPDRPTSSGLDQKA